jgi:Protein of unknown function (DUF742)
VGRRAFLQLAGASTVGGTPAACSPGSSGTGQRTIRLGYVSPQSGPLVSFGEADAFVLGDVRARLRDGLSLGRRSYPVEILVKDSQSDPERAATVANDLLRREALVFADPAAVAAARLSDERRAIAMLCAEVMSVAELSAHLGIPVGVVRVLVGDLVADGHVHLYRPGTPGARPRPRSSAAPPRARATPIPRSPPWPSASPAGSSTTRAGCRSPSSWACSWWASSSIR